MSFYQDIELQQEYESDILSDLKKDHPLFHPLPHHPISKFIETHLKHLDKEDKDKIGTFLLKKRRESFIREAKLKYKGSE